MLSFGSDFFHLSFLTSFFLYERASLFIDVVILVFVLLNISIEYILLFRTLLSKGEKKPTIEGWLTKVIHGHSRRY